MSFFRNEYLVGRKSLRKCKIHFLVKKAECDMKMHKAFSSKQLEEFNQ
jgi:hypothetical protein